MARRGARQGHLRRRGLVGVAMAVALAAAWSVGIGPSRTGLGGTGLGAIASAQAADDGIAVESRARYVIDPAGGPVQASVTMTLRNTKPDTATRRYYFTGYSLPVPMGAASLAATSDGRALSVRVEDAGNPTTQLAVASFAPLYYGRSRTIEWSYLIPGAPVRSANANRVGPGYATFAVQAAGDPGHVSVEVVAPVSMTVDTSGKGFERQPEGDVARYVTSTATDDSGIWAVVSARDPLVADETKVSVGDVTISLNSFPGDTTWTDFVSAHVTKGLPVLERVTGMPWPGGLDSIREDVAPQALQYAWFDGLQGDIVVAEDLDATTLFHEMSHTWFDADHFAQRWLYEGLAEVVAKRVVTETDQDAAPYPAPDRAGSAAIPLTAWTSAHQGSFEVEDYAYAAAATAMTELLGGLDEKAFAAVIRSAYAGESAYEPAGSGLERSTPTDWRRFLDLVEGRGGVAGADQAYRTWVVSPEEASQLDARAAARTEYAQIDEADGAWQPPLGLRRAMTDWDFDQAGAVAGALGAAAQDAAAVAEAAKVARLPVPPAVREAYESAASPAHYARLAPLLQRTAQALPAVGAARDAAASDHDPFSWLGQAVLGIDGAAATAQSAIAEGDGGSAVRAAHVATSRAGAAPWVGVGLVVVLLGGAAGATTAIVRGVRRRRRRETATYAPATQLAPKQQAPVEQHGPVEQQMVLPAPGEQG